ncbi:adenylyl-sulfate kinase [Helicobacter bilis]|uniref:Adenylyl-sulfate kinase n=1 Tax=Helicobacter bilis TaxID=37372 RepID=A0A4U8UCH4_9HELI|nr:adenylyl-sulfate kinase [Helicobacter bilis]MCI7411399.1 adenylyl-sulfate kinase [Helicobacter bilis]MDD7297432.1 adenylyl-sulfate kinase [Helicobacter bilis]MDY4400284.1 adenylyl-sulfate kinase [Helicobacter bilis]TLE10013.1 adenylyl-sulfate kinase [Helicobacter bilis]TLE11823.1 adenylyl-sulfate kinase [Helicobacter bilis]
MTKSGLIFITGLSGSGKSTLAKALIQKIDEVYNTKAIFLDGDVLRECVGNTDYSKDGREKMSMYYVRTAKMLVEQGFIVVLATISMFESIRKFNRENFTNYLEVYLNVNVDILRLRDSKGYYKDGVDNMAFMQGLVAPTQSDLVFYDNFDSKKAIDEILEKTQGF